MSSFPYAYYLIILLQLWSYINSNSDFKDLDIEEEFRQYNVTMDTIFENELGQVYYKYEKLVFHCINIDKKKVGLHEAFEQLVTKVIEVKELVINNCKLTATPLVNSLGQLKINVSAIEKLFIVSNDTDSLPQANHTTGLNLKSFGVSAMHTNFFELNENFFESMTNLIVLIVKGTKVPPIPKTIKIKKLSLTKASVKNWIDCKHLEVLSLSNIDINETPEDWLKNCSQLKALRVNNSPDIHKFIAVSKIEKVLESVNTMILLHNQLVELPLQLLEGAKNLSHLDVSFNLLNDEALLKFPLHKNLIIFKVAANKLTGWSLFNIMQQMPILKELDVSRNNFLDLFCNFGSNIPLFINNAKQLERLSFENMNMNPNCFEGAHFTKLEYINISPINEITIPTLKLQNLPKSNASTLFVDMHNYHAKRIVHFNFEPPYRISILLGERRTGYKDPENFTKTNLIIRLGSMECECLNYDFVRSLRDVPDWIKFEDLKCKENGINVMKVDSALLDCFKSTFTGHRTGCKSLETYNQLKRTKITLVCKNDMQRFAFDEDFLWYNFTKIDFSNNKINSLYDTEWPDSAKIIDVRGNRISRLDDVDVTRIFSVPDRKIYLSQNPLICDCESKTMLDALHKNKNQVPTVYYYKVLDFDKIMCEDKNTTLSTITSYEACLIGPRIASASGGTIAFLLMIMLLLLWRYRLQVRIYLYSRGWCVFCFIEKDDESERPYDAFLSFSHGDDDYVMNKLLPKLEGEPDHFKVCVHYRDWLVGDWIPSNIMRSVSFSKRTIIVLSRSFLQSMWGSLEFRYAVASSAKEGRPRLLVLVLDDVLSGELDAELQAYISCNTYLHCDDPWFWEKLRYAMPRRKPRTRNEFNFQTREPDGHGIINPQTREVMIIQPLAAYQPIIESA